VLGTRVRPGWTSSCGKAKARTVRDADGAVLCGPNERADLDVDLQGSSGSTSFAEVAATVRTYVRRAYHDSPDGFSLDVSAGDPARTFQDPVSGSYHRLDGTSGYTCPECGNGYANAETAAPHNHDCEGNT